MKKKQALLFVDATIIARHFLDSGVLHQLAQSYEITLVFPPQGWNRMLNAGDISRWHFPFKHIEIPQERRSLFKRLFFLDQAQLRLDQEWKEIRKGWQVMIGWKAALLFLFLALPGIRSVYAFHIQRRLAALSAKELDLLIDEINPAVMLHPSTFEGYFINDVIHVANLRGIPCVLMMNSWDNPSLKRSVVGRPDAVVVWGEQTRRHSHKFMKIPNEDIYVFGAAQFDLFRYPSLHRREDFCRAQGIDPEKRLLVYAGSSKGNSEAKHLMWLDQAVTKGELIDTVILYRPHPFGCNREDASLILSGSMPNVVVDRGMQVLLEAIADGDHVGFFLTPYEDTHDLLSAADALISPLSTILIEAGMHAKPALCFIPWEEDQKSNWRLLRKFVYFRDLIDNPAILTALSYAEFLPMVGKLLSQAADPVQCAAIQDAMQYFVARPEKTYSQQLLSLVDHLVSKKSNEL
jgi:hypothetical protein